MATAGFTHHALVSSQPRSKVDQVQTITMSRQNRESLMRNALFAFVLWIVPFTLPPALASAPPSGRLPGKGPAYHIDPNKGNDSGKGTKEAPWKTIQHALTRIKAGDTLYLRGGVYHENVAIRVSGRNDAPITLRSYSGESAILDGGRSEFLATPAKAWQPFAGGGPGEYRSARAYPNLRNVIGSFADTMIGLQTYNHVKDLRSANEFIDWQDWNNTKTTDLKPLYCGPGVWYDPGTGYIHARLAHTHIEGVPRYQGETDPRKVPLILAPFRSVPLLVDGAAHVRFQDLTIRGGGYDTVVLDQAADIEFDNVVVWAGTYGLRATRTERLHIHHSALHGNAAPWTFRGDTSKRAYPGRPHRDITRLNTHALLVADAGKEFSVYATPINDDWEIDHSDFTDAHDGLYLGGINVRFHHNRIHGLQDDGLYLSPMYTRYSPRPVEIHIYQNQFGKCLTALAFGGPELVTRDHVLIYRNVVDLRDPVATGRPSVKQPKAGLSPGKVMGDHGGPPWPRMTIYHNTFVMAGSSRSADMALLGAAHADRPRRLFNNVFLHLARLPGLRLPEADRCQSDGNLYWFPGLNPATAKAFFVRYRNSLAFAASKKVYPDGFTSHSLVADPQFTKAGAKPGVNDYRPRPGSPLVDAGVELPKEWPDPLRAMDRGKPDIGALPLR
jgi:Protein of unknown function (DUF1565)